MSEVHLKLIISVSMPFLLPLILFLYSGIRNKEKSFLEFLMNFYLSFFIFNQSIFSKLIDLIACRSFQFDDNFHESYLRNYLGIKCFDESHYFWIYFFIIPFFIFYGLLVPISTLIFAYLKKNEISKNIFKFDFMMRQPFQSKNASFWYFINNIYFTHI
jgi:hypothetical protein